MHSQDRSSPRARGAFTLIELLVVIGIIAILLGILMPVMSRARESARSVACLSNVRQLGMAVVQYAMENQGQFPNFAIRAPYAQLKSDWVWWKNSSVHSDDVTQSAIAKYVGPNALEALLKCPSDEGVRTNMFGGDPPYKYSYTLNCFFTGWQSGSFNSSQATIRITQVRNGASKILLAEEDERSLNDGGFWPRGDYLSIRHDRTRVYPDTFQAANMTRRGNVAFCDGHAEYVERGFAHDPNNYEPAR